MLRTLFAGYSRVMALLSKLTLILCGIALLVIIGTTGWQVYGRYVLNDPPSWVESLAILLLLFVSFPGAAVGIREKFHLGIFFLLDMMPPKTRRAFELIGVLILFGFGVAMASGGYDATAQTWSVSDPILSVPRGMSYLPICIAGVLMVLFGIEQIGEFFLGGRDAPGALSDGSNSVAEGDVD